MKRLIVSLFIAGVLSACGPAMEQEETTAPETIESTEETIVEETPEETTEAAEDSCEYHFVCEDFEAKPETFQLLGKHSEEPMAIYGKKIEGQYYLLAHFGEEKVAFSSKGEKVVDLVWGDYIYAANVKAVVIMEESESGEQEAFCVGINGEIQVAVFDKESLLQGGARGSAELVHSLSDQDFLKKDLSLLIDENHGRVVLDHQSQPYFIPCASGMEQWKKENGTVKFFVEWSGVEGNENPYLWGSYQLPEINDSYLGEVQVQFADINGAHTARVIWAEDVQNSVWAGPRFGQEEHLMSTSLAKVIAPITNEEEFFVLASAKPQDLATAWDYTKNGKPSDGNNVELMKVGQNEVLTVYTVATQEKAQLALYVWAEDSLVFPIGGEGFDANYGMQIYGQDGCCYTGMNKKGELYRQWVMVSASQSRVLQNNVGDYEISPVEASETEKTMLLQVAGGEKLEEIKLNTMSTDGRIVVAVPGEWNPKMFYLACDQQVWKIELPCAISSHGAVIYELQPGEWLIKQYAAYEEEKERSFKTRVLFQHVVLQADGSLLVESWN